MKLSGQPQNFWTEIYLNFQLSPLSVHLTAPWSVKPPLLIVPRRLLKLPKQEASPLRFDTISPEGRMPKRWWSRDTPRGGKTADSAHLKSLTKHSTCDHCRSSEKPFFVPVCLRSALREADPNFQVTKNDILNVVYRARVVKIHAREQWNISKAEGDSPEAHPPCTVLV
jgi:hypothetical protein